MLHFFHYHMAWHVYESFLQGTYKFRGLQPETVRFSQRKGPFDFHWDLQILALGADVTKDGVVRDIKPVMKTWFTDIKEHSSSYDHRGCILQVVKLLKGVSLMDRWELVEKPLETKTFV